MIYLIPFVLATFGRYRGMHKPWLPRAQMNRILFWGVPAGLCTFLCFDLTSWAFPALVAAFWLGLAIKGWGQWYHVRNWKEFLFMTLRGLAFTGFAGVVLGLFYPTSGLILALSGLTMSFAYWLGRKTPTLNKKFLNQGPEWGEVYSCFLVGVGIVIAALVW